MPTGSEEYPSPTVLCDLYELAEYLQAAKFKEHVENMVDKSKHIFDKHLNSPETITEVYTRSADKDRPVRRLLLQRFNDKGKRQDLTGHTYDEYPAEFLFDALVDAMSAKEAFRNELKVQFNQKTETYKTVAQLKEQIRQMTVDCSRHRSEVNRYQQERNNIRNQLKQAEAKSRGGTNVAESSSRGF